MEWFQLNNFKQKFDSLKNQQTIYSNTLRNCETVSLEGWVFAGKVCNSYRIGSGTNRSNYRRLQFVKTSTVNINCTGYQMDCMHILMNELNNSRPTFQCIPTLWQMLVSVLSSCEFWVLKCSIGRWKCVIFEPFGTCLYGFRLLMWTSGHNGRLIAVKNIRLAFLSSFVTDFCKRNWICFIFLLSMYGLVYLCAVCNIHTILQKRNEVFWKNFHLSSKIKYEETQNT